MKGRCIFYMQNKQQFEKLVEQLGLMPVIPLSNYDKRPYMSWTIETNIINNMETLNNVLTSNVYNYTTKDNEVKTLNNITGFSLLTGNKSNIVVIDLDLHLNKSSS